MMSFSPHQTNHLLLMNRLSMKKMYDKLIRERKLVDCQTRRQKQLLLGINSCFFPHNFQNHNSAPIYICLTGKVSPECIFRCHISIVGIHYIYPTYQGQTFLFWSIICGFIEYRCLVHGTVINAPFDAILGT